MASTTLLTLSLLLLSLSFLSSSSSASTLLDAAEILSTSGFESMAMNLELAAQTLPQPPSLTIFAPTDLAFQQLPHHLPLSLSLLRFHLLPHAFSLHSLTSLPFGASIPTLLPRHSLTVTTTPRQLISINNVSINPSPIFHHPNLTIFSTQNFFNPHFHLLPQHPPPKPATCPPPPQNSLSNATRALHSRGFSLMASVLDVQFPAACTDRRHLTLFAPVDEAVANHARNLTEFPALLRRHLIPCKIAWRDLASLKDGTLIATYERGFAVNVTKSRTHTLLLNGVPVVFPEMYRGDWLVVHGVRNVLSDHKGKRHHRAKRDSDRVSASVAAQDGEESSEFHNRDGEGSSNSPQHYHFSVFH